MDWAGEVSALYSQYVHTKQSFFSFCSQELVERLPLRPDIRVLDLAGGAGIVSRMILTREPSAKITILDASAEQLEHAKSVFGDKVTSVFERAEQYAPTEQFDIIVCANAFWYLRLSIIPKIASWLAPGGIFAFNLHEENTILKDKSFWRSVYQTIDTLSRDKYRTSCVIYERITPIDELKHILHTNGFTVEMNELVTEEPAESWKLLAELEARRTAPFMALSIPAEEKVALFKEAFKSVMKQKEQIPRYTLMFMCKH